MTTIDPKRAALLLPNGDTIPLHHALGGAALGGFAPTVIVAPVVTAEDTRVEPAAREWKLEGHAPEVIVAPVKDEGEGAE